MGEIVYAGGKQTEGNIEILVVKEVTQSYLTKLWNRDEFKEQEENKKVSFVNILSRYFTYIVLTIAAATAVYWQINDPSRMWPAVTAIFIIACPCALFLSIHSPMVTYSEYLAEIIYISGMHKLLKKWPGLHILFLIKPVH